MEFRGISTHASVYILSARAVTNILRACVQLATPTCYKQSCVANYLLSRRLWSEWLVEAPESTVRI